MLRNRIKLLAFVSCLAAAPLVHAGQGSAAPAAPDSDSLVKALETLASDPRALREALRKAEEEFARRKAEPGQNAGELDRRIELLHRASLALGVEPAPDGGAPPEFTPEINEAFAARFEREVWPLITAGGRENNCFSCHDAKTKTPLEFPEDGHAAYSMLLRLHYFEPENPASLLARLGALKEDERMPPPPSEAWDEGHLRPVRAFVKDLYDARLGSARDEDERFPAELEKPFHGAEAEALAKESVSDNTFLTYRQLRAKVKTIFNDEWHRNERDLFDENLELFQGADFKRRFDESSKPSATFLTGLDLLAADVVSRAYIDSTGPFAEWPKQLDALAPMEPVMDAPSAAIRDGVSRLYRRILFRDPAPSELRDAFAFIAGVFSEADAPPADFTLNFDLTVKGSEGPATVRSVAIPVLASAPAIYQQRIPQRQPGPLGVIKQRVGTSFKLKAGAPGQSFGLFNVGSSGAVAFGGIEIVGPLPNRSSRVIKSDDPSVEMRGPWTFNKKSKLDLLQDGDENKGACSLRVPLAVDRDGEYEVYLRWVGFAKRQLADSVLVEVCAPGETRLAMPSFPARPPAGEAHFFIDQTEDRIPYFDLRTSFRFASDQEFVEINNAGTRKRVTADAVNFVSDAGATLVVDNGEAEGREDWPVFDDYPFRPYNIVGADCLSDKAARKGELKIRYKPAVKKDAWKADQFYRVQVVYAGQENNDSAVPLVVKAAASSPIVRIALPNHAPLGATVTMDASASYDTQGGALDYTWTQTGGPKVELSDPRAATVAFAVKPASPAQRAWEGLARALVNHPDFVFTRAPSLRRNPDLSPADRQRLRLAKIAQDLVARPPTDAEIAELEKGATLETMIDRYLSSDEFRDFYFHRVRLYLESHGTDEEDEPARLWTHIAVKDRPIQELITADYTVDAALKRVERPAHHGATGVLTMRGFIKGKPGLPHFNYAAQVAEKFLGYVFEVPPEIVEQREGITAISTTNPGTVCYACHKVLTPLAFQRLHWDDDGNYRTHDNRGLPIDASDQGLVPSYPFRGDGLEAFAASAQRKERFLRTMINTHFTFYFGRAMRHDKDERALYRRLWDATRDSGYTIKGMIRAMLLSPEYLGDDTQGAASRGDIARAGGG